MMLLDTVVYIAVWNKSAALSFCILRIAFGHSIYVSSEIRGVNVN